MVAPSDKDITDHLADCTGCITDITLDRTAANATKHFAADAVSVKSVEDPVGTWVINWFLRPLAVFALIGIFVGIVAMIYLVGRDSGIFQARLRREKETRKSIRKRNAVRGDKGDSARRQQGLEERLETWTPVSDADPDDVNEESVILHKYDQERYLQGLGEGSECSEDDSVDGEGTEKPWQA